MATTLRFFVVLSPILDWVRKTKRRDPKIPKHRDKRVYMTRRPDETVHEEAGLCRLARLPSGTNPMERIEGSSWLRLCMVNCHRYPNWLTVTEFSNLPPLTIVALFLTFIW